MAEEHFKVPQALCVCLYLPVACSVWCIQCKGISAYAMRTGLRQNHSWLCTSAFTCHQTVMFLRIDTDTMSLIWRPNDCSSWGKGGGSFPFSVAV